MPAHEPEASYNRRAVLTVTCGVLGGSALAGCTGPDEQPALSIDNVEKAVTDDDRIRVSVFVRNDGDASGEVTAKARLERDGAVHGPKSDTVSVLPRSQSVTHMVFDPGVDGTPSLPTYTASVTIPDHDWVTAAESEFTVTTNERPGLAVLDVTKRRTDNDEVEVRVLVRNDGDENEDVTVTARLTHDDTVYGPKSSEVSVVAGSENDARISFDPAGGADPSTYTASATIPGHDWVTADESAGTNEN